MRLSKQRGARGEIRRWVMGCDTLRVEERRRQVAFCLPWLVTAGVLQRKSPAQELLAVAVLGAAARV